MRNTENYYERYRPLIFRIAVLFLVFVCVSIDLDAQKKDKKKVKIKMPDIDVQVGLKSYYDNNILKYSDKYLDRFINLEDEGRFHINTYDDVVLSPSFNFGSKFYLIKKKPAQVKFFMRNNLYMNNSIKNWHYFFARVEQYYHKRGKIGFQYDYIPDFYIRHYRDDDYTHFMGYVPGSFKRMAFSKENFRLYIQHRIKKTTARLELNYTQYFYNVHYIEYDSKEPNVELSLSRSFLDNKLRLSGSVAYKLSKAKAIDQDGELVGESDDADASFIDYAFSASARYKIPKLFGHTNYFSIDAYVGRKNFTTDHFVEYDMLHAGRTDFNYKMSFAYKYYISSHWDMEIFYNRYGRETSSLSDINSHEVWNEKSYSQYQVGFNVSYSFDIKSKKAKSKKSASKKSSGKKSSSSKSNKTKKK